MGQSFAQVARKLDKVAADLERLGWDEVGKALAPDITKAVAGTLGDQSMSGWKRGAPIQIVGSYKVRADSVFLSAGKGSGPMRVLQDGRNRGGGGGFAGPGVNAKTGTTRRTKSGGVAKTRSRKAKRWNGTTAAKHTWDHAADAMAERAPRLVFVQVGKTLGKTLNKG